MPKMISYSVGLVPENPNGVVASSCVVEPPPGYAAGNTLLMVVEAGGSAGAVVPATPSGWTAVGNASSTLYVFRKTASAAESAYTVEFASACTAAVVVAAYPASTVVFSSFQHSGADVVGWTPTFPSGVTSGQTVLMFTGALVSLTGVNLGSQSATLTLPSTDPWVAPFLGPGVFNSTVNLATPGVGIAEYQGSATAPEFTSNIGSAFFAGFLVLNVGTTPVMTVTATGGANAGLGMALTVKALTGAASAAEIIAGAATASVDSVGAGVDPQTSITPNGTGSWIFGALWNYGDGTAFTPSPGITFSQNIGDTGTNAAYGTFRTTATTHAGTPVTVGASAPADVWYDLAAAEILADGTLAEALTAEIGATQPWQYAGIGAQQTAYFVGELPQPGSLLVAVVSCGSQAFGATMTMTDSMGLTWTELASVTYPAYTGVWIAQVPYGSMALPKPALSGAGTASEFGSGQLRVPKPRVAAAGWTTVAGDGTLSLAKPAVLGGNAPIDGLSIAGLANLWLSWLGGNPQSPPAGLYLQLHNGPPGPGGTGNVSSVAARHQLTLAVSGAAAAETGTAPAWAAWDGTEGEQLTHISAWDDPSAGVFLFSAQVEVPQIVPSGETVQVAGLTFAIGPVSPQDPASAISAVVTAALTVSNPDFTGGGLFIAIPF